MAVIKVVNSKASIGRAINYVTKGEKTEEKLVSGKDCNPHTAIDEMKATKEQWGKTEGRQYKHYIQSFNPEDRITPQKAHEVGRKFVENTEKFKGHEVVIATHVDKGHIHNHFIVNTVNFENGRKLQQSKQDLEKLKLESDNLCKEHGLHVIQRDKDKTINLSMKQYKALEKGESRQARLVNSIEYTRKQAISKEDFLQKMDKLGYEVQWTDKRARVTYIDKEYKALNDQRQQLGEKGVKYKFSEKSLVNYGISKEAISKGGLLNEFSRNDEKERATGIERTTSRGSTSTDILLKGNRETHEINSSRASDIDKSNQQSIGRKQDRPTEPSQEIGGKRTDTNRIDEQNKRDIQGIKAGNDRPQSNEPARDRKELQGNLRRQKEERGNTQRNDKADKGHGIHSKTDPQPQLEGKGETVRSATPNNNRVDSGIGRSISTGEPFGEILKSLSSAIQKADNIEKTKAEQQQKALQKQQQREQTQTKTRARSNDFDMER